MWKSIFTLFLVVVVVYLSTCRNDAGFSEPKLLALDNEYSSDYTAEVIPRIHITVETDTILSNNFRVKIKYNSTDKNILKISKKEYSRFGKTLYREFISTLEISVKDRIIFDQEITRHYFNTDTDDKFWRNAILQYVEIDQLATQLNESVVIKFSFVNPVIDKSRFYSLLIDENGRVQIINDDNVL